MDLYLQVDLSLRLIIAVMLSAVVGYDRERHDHPAGLRTHILVGLGSALFTVLSLYAFGNGDHGRVAAQIVTGIGFLGAGAIIQGRSGRSIRGMTTAAGIWAVAAIGMACGTGSYLVAAVASLLTWFVLAVLGHMEKRVRIPDVKTNPETKPESPPQVDSSGLSQKRSKTRRQQNH
jgi:putative Mg2+ transporter-C (MgtC) family protein